MRSTGSALPRPIRIVGSVLIALTLLLAAASCGSRDDSSSEPRLASQVLPATDVGIAAGSATTSSSSADLDSYYAQVRQLGATWVRVDLPWSLVEPTRGSYSWADVDRTVESAKAHGLSVIGVLAYTPPWARLSVPRTSDKVAPANPADYGVYAGAVAAHFKGRVSAYELWNEPNIVQFFAPRVDPSLYVRMMQAAYPLVKAADPSAVVLSAGLANIATDQSATSILDFTNAMYAAGAGGFFDAADSHPYTYPASPADPHPNSFNAFANLGTIHDIMAAHGDGAKKIWVTEYGAPTGNARQAVSAARQAQLILDGLAVAYRLQFVDKVMIYSLRDTGTNPADPEQNFGLITASGQKKPSFTALQQALMPGAN